MFYSMHIYNERVDGALDFKVTGPFTAEIDLNFTCINTRADTHSCTMYFTLAIYRFLICLYHVIHQSYMRLLFEFMCSIK